MSEMTLGQKQRHFTRMVGLLIEFAYQNGYELTVGAGGQPGASTITSIDVRKASRLENIQLVAAG